QIFASLSHRRVLRSWGWVFLSGLVDLVLGGLIVSGWPGTSTWVIGLLVGINLFMVGIALIMTAFASRDVTPVAPPRAYRAQSVSAFDGIAAVIPERRSLIRDRNTLERLPLCGPGSRLGKGLDDELRSDQRPVAGWPDRRASLAHLSHEPPARRRRRWFRRVANPNTY